MTANIVAFAPMPSANTKTDETKNLRRVLNTRRANPASCRSASNQLVHRSRESRRRSTFAIPVATRRRRRTTRARVRWLGRRVSTRDQFGDTILEVKPNLSSTSRAMDRDVDGSENNRRRPAKRLLCHVDGLSSGALSRRSTAST